jgi:hypothetical protein
MPWGDSCSARPKVEKRQRWIRDQRRVFETMNAIRPPLRYVTGATHRYLGRQYRLKITIGPKTRVTLKGAYLHIELPEAVESEAKVEAALEAWYRERAQEQFARRLHAWADWC